MTQDASLDQDRWSRFDTDRQILMIGNPDAHRAAFRALLQLRPTSALQIPLLPG